MGKILYPFILAAALTSPLYAEEKPGIPETENSSVATEIREDGDSCRQECAEDNADPDECQMDCNTVT